MQITELENSSVQGFKVREVKLLSYAGGYRPKEQRFTKLRNKAEGCRTEQNSYVAGSRLTLFCDPLS